MIHVLQIECQALAVALVLALLAPRQARVLHVALLRLCGRLGRSPQFAALGLGLVTVAFTGIHAAIVHWPEPSIHDEFAYLLGAETFARGELSRPAHAFWQHFETLHVLQEPTYSSKYPPGQSLSLALGIVWFGQVRAALWVQSGVLVGALVWLISRWQPKRYAVLGGGLLALQLALVGPWVQTFYGGALAAIGGALLLGAVPRPAESPTVLRGVLLGAGLVLLGTTRPYEGLVASLPVAVVLARRWLAAPAASRRRLETRCYLPIAAWLAVGAAAVMLHNQAVTGDATEMPYVAYDQRYSVYPPFLWQPLADVPEYRHASIERFMLGFQAGDHGLERTPLALGELAVRRQAFFLQRLLGVELMLPLGIAALLAFVRSRRSGLAGGGRTSLALPGFILLGTAIATSATTYAAPHYAAPALGALSVVLMGAWRSVARWRPSVRYRGSAVLMACVMALVTVSGYRASKRWLGGERYLGYVRAQLRETLLSRPGPDLVIVREAPSNSVHQEFVYNQADIDGARIVWARDLGDSANEGLMDYFANRVVWLLDVRSVIEDDWTLTLVRTAADGVPFEPSASEAW